MTKALLQIIKAEFEHTEPELNKQKHLDSLCEKYSCTKKDLKGYTKWSKGFDTTTKIKLLYETVYSPEIEEDLEKSDEELEFEIHETADKIVSGEVVSNPSQKVKQLNDGFEGLRLLDTKLQTQALGLLGEIDKQMGDIETAKDVRDLVAAHVQIRDSYFNTQAPMINIINGNVDNSNKNELAVLLDNTEEDC